MSSYLEVGDLVEAGALMGNMTDEQVILQVVEGNDDAVRFEATMFGVNLGFLDVEVDAGVVVGGLFHE